MPWTKSDERNYLQADKRLDMLEVRRQKALDAAERSLAKANNLKPGDRYGFGDMVENAELVRHLLAPFDTKGGR